MVPAVALVFALVGPAPLARADTAPDWFRQHLAFLTRDGGRWLTDNSAYRGPNEPWVTYGIEWALLPSGEMAVGRLFGVTQDGTEQTFWDFVSYWDALADEAVVIQTAGGGRYGAGSLRPTGAGSWELEQTFWSPDGPTRQLHREQVVDGTQDSHAFTWRDGAWQPGRHYVWRRALPANH